MLSVADALATIFRDAAPLAAESVPLENLSARVAAHDIKAPISKPSFAASSMDGYAVRFADVQIDASLDIVGESPAGKPCDVAVGVGEAVRIFTGAALPEGADHVIIQEDVRREGSSIIVTCQQDRPANIRAVGIDFQQGESIIAAGERLGDLHGALLASANIVQIACVRRPRVALFSNGDELKPPGTKLGPGEIVDSNHFALSALIKSWGGEPVYLGCAPDDETAIVEMFQRGAHADVIVPIGGASVGDYDFVKSAFARVGGTLSFEKVAIRPGKPTWHGSLGAARILGLPGNPASSIVSAAVFLKPLVRALGGRAIERHTTTASLEQAIAANGNREHYMRAHCNFIASGGATVSVFANQDSSLLTPLTACNALVRRMPGAPASAKGDAVDVIPFYEPPGLDPHSVI